MDTERKRELKRMFKEAEQAEARTSLGLSQTQLSSLLASLDDHLSSEGISCDHTLNGTESWARNQGFAPEFIAQAVRRFGGYCDCEVLDNVTPDKFGWQE